MLECEGLLDHRDGVEGCYVWEVEVREAHVEGLSERMLSAYILCSANISN